jgi:hypothetical protein
MNAPAPARLTISPNDLDAATSITIPLQVRPIASGGYKIGIEVALSPPGSSAPGDAFLYELDTGGKGFFASGVTPPPSTYGAVADTYASGNQFTGEAAVMNVSFPGASVTQAFPVLIGLITSFATSRGAATFPDDDNGFYGDFGASLEASQVEATQQPPNSVSLLTVLAQLGSTFGNGFIVDVGPFPNGGSGSGQLIAGLTPALRSLFPNTIAMAGAGSYTPVSNPGAASVPTYQARAITGTLSVGSLSPISGIGILFDTGAPHTTFHPGTTLTSAYAPARGDTVTLTAGGVTILSFEEGTTLGVNRVKMAAESATNGAGYVNTGLAPFFANPILFDLAEGKIGFPSA